MLPALIAGGVGLASAYMAYRGQQKANKANIRQADIDRQWQQKMSSTSHQREVKDLKAAGLNPVLSATKGASTPSGSKGVVISPTKDTAQSMLNSSKAVNNVKLTKELIATEKTKQLLNTVASAKGYQDGRSSKYQADINEMHSAWELSKFGRGLWKFGKGAGRIGNIIPKIMAVAK